MGGRRAANSETQAVLAAQGRACQKKSGDLRDVLNAIGLRTRVIQDHR